MSFTGKPAQDLAVSNLAAKTSVVSPNLVVGTLSTALINNVPQLLAVLPIKSIFNGATIGNVTYRNGPVWYSFWGQPNQSNADLDANVQLGYVADYSAKLDVYVPVLIYCPAAPTISNAGFSATVQISSTGIISVDTKVGKEDLWKGNKCTIIKTLDD